MPVQVDNRDGVTMVRPSGRIDSSNAVEFEQVVAGKLDEGCVRLVFDFSDLDFMSSAGLRVVLVAAKRMREAKGKLAFAGLRENVRDVFEMSGFLKLFNAHDGLEQAIASVK
jgi:anti-anti-sigma factor